MKNTKLLIILGFVLLLIGFYWFQIRPSSIRSFCATDTIEKLKAKTGKLSTGGWQEEYNLYYKACINEKGLR